MSLERLRVAVVGTGISGLSAAWLLDTRHHVTIYEKAPRLGGHSNTVDVATDGGPVAVDTGFIVYNELNYPNLTALFAHLEVPTRPSDMTFAVSLDGGQLEYSGGRLSGLFVQKRNMFRPRFWSMVSDLHRFYREAPSDIAALDDLRTTLGDYLESRSYGSAFKDDHLLPMAAAIWSAAPKALLDYPAGAFIRFHDNHGLLRLRDRPLWRTVAGGSRVYIERMMSQFRGAVRTGAGVASLRRDASGVIVIDEHGAAERFDHVVIATHADQALAMLGDAGAEERSLLGSFRYSRNEAVLHSDPSMMPRRRAVWSSWNYIGRRDRSDQICVTYWMNRLQQIPDREPLFVTLNADRPPQSGTIHHCETYEHPLFDAAAMAAQRRLWSLQGRRKTWFCGSYFGAGFHEDGLQSGLAVAEALGGVRRPWLVDNESARICLEPQPTDTPARDLVA